jgi:hypothetical protein
MEFCTAERSDLESIIELYKQLNPSNENFLIEDANKVWDNIEYLRELNYQTSVIAVFAFLRNSLSELEHEYKELI